MKKLFFLFLITIITCNYSYAMKDDHPIKELFEAAKNGEMEKADLLLKNNKFEINDIYEAGKIAVNNNHGKLACFLLHVLENIRNQPQVDLSGKFDPLGRFEKRKALFRKKKVQELKRQFELINFKSTND